MHLVVLHDLRQRATKRAGGRRNALDVLALEQQVSLQIGVRVGVHSFAKVARNLDLALAVANVPHQSAHARLVRTVRALVHIVAVVECRHVARRGPNQFLHIWTVLRGRRIALDALEFTTPDKLFCKCLLLLV